MRRTSRLGLWTTDSHSRRWPAATRRTARLRLEQLEGRALPSFGFGWALGVGGPNHDAGDGIATDALGSVYVSGEFSGTVNFDPTGSPAGALTSAGSTDSFAAKVCDEELLPVT